MESLHTFCRAANVFRGYQINLFDGFWTELTLDELIVQYETEEGYKFPQYFLHMKKLNVLPPRQTTRHSTNLLDTLRNQEGVLLHEVSLLSPKNHVTHAKIHM